MRITELDRGPSDYQLTVIPRDRAVHQDQIVVRCSADPNAFLRESEVTALPRSLEELDVKLCNQDLLNSLQIQMTANRPEALRPATGG